MDPMINLIQRVAFDQEMELRRELERRSRERKDEFSPAARRAAETRPAKRGLQTLWGLIRFGRRPA